VDFEMPFKLFVRNYKDRDTEKCFTGQKSKLGKALLSARIYDQAGRVVMLLKGSRDLTFAKHIFSASPNWRLKKLNGRDNAYSIRLNDQWRIIFYYDEKANEAYDLEVTPHDYKVRT